MQVRHLGERTIADTDAMRAITCRSRWVIRSRCERGPDGYDVDTCAAAVAAAPEPVLLTAADAWQYLGIRAGNVRQWASKGRLTSYDRNEHGHPLYDALDLRRLGRLAPGPDRL